MTDTNPSDQLSAVLVEEDPTAGLWHLVDSGWADEHLPELPALRLEQDPIHRHKDVLTWAGALLLDGELELGLVFSTFPFSYSHILTFPF